MKREKYTIDATGKSLGRLACEIVPLLRGKNRPDFAPYKDEGANVVVENIDKMKITGKKLKDKRYIHHTEHPGGFTEIRMEKLIDKKGIGEVLRRAVSGMLPKNKLRPKMMKRLNIK
ncbi:MAG: 50S ribosomal protein L13 [Parcubacteria group bacterium]|nr:50S ribosomal protein L13 [Parcubacteria group bacterium]